MFNNELFEEKKKEVLFANLVCIKEAFLPNKFPKNFDFKNDGLS